MKRILMLLSISLIFVANIAEAQAYRETDRFTGKTTIYSTKRRINLTRARALYFLVSEEGVEQVVEHPEWTLIRGCFQEWGQGSWKYLEYHDLIFLADGESIKIGDTDHDGNVGAFGGPKLYEYVYFSISWTDFNKLLDADTVEYRLGAYERKLKKIDFEEMRSFRDEILK